MYKIVLENKFAKSSLLHWVGLLWNEIKTIKNELSESVTGSSLIIQAHSKKKKEKKESMLYSKILLQTYCAFIDLPSAHPLPTLYLQRGPSSANPEAGSMLVSLTVWLNWHHICQSSYSDASWCRKEDICIIGQITLQISATGEEMMNECGCVSMCVFGRGGGTVCQTISGVTF